MIETVCVGPLLFSLCLFSVIHRPQATPCEKVPYEQVKKSSVCLRANVNLSQFVAGTSLVAIAVGTWGV